MTMYVEMFCSRMAFVLFHLPFDVADGLWALELEGTCSLDWATNLQAVARD